MLGDEMQFLSKIPERTRARLNEYVSLCNTTSDSKYFGMKCRISAAISVLYDIGCFDIEDMLNALMFYRELADKEFYEEN